jgi:beta-N-acetylhexosaminidase
MPQLRSGRSFAFRWIPLCLAAAVAWSCAAPLPVSNGPSPVPVTPFLTASDPATCATTTLAAMTEDQRVGELFMLGINGAAMSAAEVAALQAYHLGSTFLVNSRQGGAESIRTLTAQIQSLATDSNTYGVRLFIAADQEGGYVQRLNGPGFDKIPTALEQGGLSTSTLEADAVTWGKQLAAAGINLNLAPVMDVVPPGTDADNAPIGALEREYGHDPTTAGDHGSAVVRGMAGAGVATALKHFPGLGRVVGNTDNVGGVVDSVTTAQDPYLASFQAGITAGAPFVMISLATYSKIDPDRQAVFSTTIIGTILRGQLGFTGVVVSDDIGAAAAVASMAAGDRATAFITAGGDLMIVSGVSAAGQMAEAVLSHARADSAFEAQVDAAATRVLQAKAAYGLLSCA